MTARCVLLALLLCPPSLAAAAEVQLTLSKEVEEHKPVLVAKLTADGKPVEDATIVFYARRTFGNLVLGQEKTLDDGTAAVAFPDDLPGGQNGILHLAAEYKPPDKTTDKPSAVRAEQAFEGGARITPENLTLPRALWSPSAPLVLVVTVTLLMAFTWACYAFVAWQIIKIRKGVPV